MFRFVYGTPYAENSMLIQRFTESLRERMQEELLG